MFEHIFSKQYTIKKHLNAPMLEERLRVHKTLV